MSFSLDENDSVTEDPIIEPVVRKRGRPPGSKNKNGNTAEGISTDPIEKPKRRKRKPKAEDIEFAAKRLVGMHAMLAAFTGTPEFQISDVEARMLAESGLQVQREFDIEVGGKWAVLATFVGICGMVYVPRIGVMAQRAKARKRDAGVTINGTADGSNT